MKREAGRLLVGAGTWGEAGGEKGEESPAGIHLPCRGYGGGGRAGQTGMTSSRVVLLPLPVQG